MRKDCSGNVLIHEDSMEIVLYNKNCNNRTGIFRSFLITDFILHKNSFRHHFIAFEDILNLKQFAVVIKDE